GERRESGEEDLEQPHLRQGNGPERRVTRIESQSTIFPETLKGSICPTETLPRESPERTRCLRPGNRRAVEEHAIAVPLEIDRKVLVFGNRVGLEAAKSDQSFPAPRPNGAWHHGQRAERRERATLKVLSDNVFERLPARDHVDTVTYLGV